MRKTAISIMMGLVCIGLLTSCASLDIPMYASPSDTGIVAVGMGRSAKYGKCEGAGQDLATMTAILSKYGKVNAFQDNTATKKNVVAALKEAAKKDLMIFYYSGHGGSDPVGDVSEEKDGKNEYLCLYDTYMLDNEIWEIIKSAKGRVFCIFDCCHAQTMYRVPSVTLENAIARSPAVMSERSSVNMLVWAGCPENNYSYGDSSGGVFTNAIRDSYKKGRSYSAMWDRIHKKAVSQYPKLTQLGYGFGGPVFR